MNSQMRRGSWETAEAEIEEILDAFNLGEKRHTVASSISWGMKRKLQLGVAIVGGPLVGAVRKKCHWRVK